MSSHTYKNQQEKANYKRYIRNLDYEPTLDERVNFPESDKSDEELSVSETSKKRRESNSEIIGEYLKKNWVSWLIGIFTLGLLYFMGDAKIDIARLFEKSETNKESIIKNTNVIEKLREQNHNQDMKIQDNKYKNENLENVIKHTPTTNKPNAR